MKSIDDAGYTLIEMILALSIISALALLTVSLCMSGVSQYKRSVDCAELQFQARYVTDFVTDKIRESQGVAYAIYSTQSHMNSVAEWNKANRFSVKCPGSTECYIFELKEISGKIFYGRGSAIGNGTAELGCYVSEIYIGTAKDGVSLRDTDTVNVRICFERGKETYVSESTVFMRNSN